MKQVGHAVVGVHEDARAGLDRSQALLVGRRRVAQRHGHSALPHRLHVGERSLTLGRQGALGDEPMRLLLPAVQNCGVGIDQVLGVLRTLVLGREERPLEKDALGAAAKEILALCLHRRHDARAGLPGLLHRCRERGREPRGSSPTGQLLADGGHARRVAVHDVVVGKAMDVRVHKAGGHPAVGAVEHLHPRRSLRSHPRKDAVGNQQVAGTVHVVGQDDVIRFDGKGIHESLPGRRRKVFPIIDVSPLRSCRRAPLPGHLKQPAGPPQMPSATAPDTPRAPRRALRTVICTWSPRGPAKTTDKHAYRWCHTTDKRKAVFGALPNHQ